MDRPQLMLIDDDVADAKLLELMLERIDSAPVLEIIASPTQAVEKLRRCASEGGSSRP